MENELKTYLPETWELRKGSKVSLEKSSQEFCDVYKALSNAGIYRKMIQLVRIQNLYTFGQLLIREQILHAISNGNTNYFRVRRYMVIPEECVKLALEYNLDERRTDIKPQFSSEIELSDAQNIVFVVQTVTDEPYSKFITPNRSSDYYIEYVATYE